MIGSSDSARARAPSADRADVRLDVKGWLRRLGLGAAFAAGVGALACGAVDGSTAAFAAQLGGGVGPDPRTEIMALPGDTPRAVATRLGIGTEDFLALNAPEHPGLSADEALRPHRFYARPSVVPGVNGTDTVTFVELGTETTHESAAMRTSGVPVARIANLGSNLLPWTDPATGQTYVFDLTSLDDTRAFVQRLGIPDSAQRERLAQLIAGVDSSHGAIRDELAQLIAAWAPAESGGVIASRLLLSGHFSHAGVFGDGNGTLAFALLRELATAMPSAARQIEDVHLSACYSAGERDAFRLRSLFPRLKTAFFYPLPAPSARRGATAHQRAWQHATRGPVEVLSRDIVSHPNHAVWSLTGGYQELGMPSLSARRATVTRGEATFQAFGRGEREVERHWEGPLRDYYNALQLLWDDVSISDAELDFLNERIPQVIRLLFWEKVATSFANEYAGALQAGYTALGLPMVDFARLSRRDALGEIAAFVAAAQNHPDGQAWERASEDVLRAVQLLRGLEALDPKVVPDRMV